ncbi:glycosyltransferase [Mesobaculum littorinae]|uniref:3-deoxy-D-manno-octulosonic acid transferase n=1 Tax=Mesobaculum littorinae TaxID=2486419 RepID=A0A438AK82_9RHOB|nr:glycosyltransferase N-terminal domain-containing protein [Mesobaculum littorinae]RVV98977.1 glycosyltransferase [Mesobaculum littorinae]
MTPPRPDIATAQPPLRLDLPPPPPLSLRLAHWAFQAAFHLALPLVLALILRRSTREPLYRRHLSHRFGGGPVAPRGAIWVFATSLGETRAVAPLVSRLLSQGHAVCLSHSSPAGLAEGRRLFPDAAVTHRYAPFDLFWAVALFLRRQRPRLGLIVEAEIWPGQILVARAMGVPMVQVNGNLVARSVARDARRAGGVRLKLLHQFRAILTKSPAYRDRYLAAGVAPERIALPGELKFDQPVPQAQRDAAARAGWRDGRPVLMIASSVADEEPALIALAAQLLSRPRSPRIVWAPRSPQRFDRLALALTAAGLQVARRSDTLAPDLSGDLPGADILLGDSLGEMTFYYALSDMVFVGATLVPHGGHTVVEPLVLGRPVLTGPSIYGITFPSEEARDAGALVQARDAEDLAARIETLLDDPAALDDMTRRARGFAARHLGAAARSADLLAPLLEDR